MMCLLREEAPVQESCKKKKNKINPKQQNLNLIKQLDPITILMEIKGTMGCVKKHQKNTVNKIQNVKLLQDKVPNLFKI